MCQCIWRWLIRDIAILCFDDCAGHDSKVDALG